MEPPLICLLVCGTLLFGFRIGVQYRRTGDHGLRLGKQNTTPVQVAATALLACALLGVLAVSILDSLSYLEPQADIGPWGTAAGVLVCATALATTMIAQLQMGDAWRIGVDASERTELVTHGMFALSRNPIYSGMLLLGIGFVILLPHVLTAFFALVSLVGFELQVRKVEEPHLRNIHGRSYESYFQRVGRFLPRTLHRYNANP